MKSIITYFIKFPIAGNILMAGILIIGYLSLTGLKSTLMPQIDPGMIEVSASYPGASPEEIEKGIILKIEDNLKSISGISKVNSSSSENSGMVRVEIETGANADVVLQDVKNAVDGINSFPSGMEPPNIRKIEPTFRAITFMVTGDVDLKVLKDYARRAEEDIRGMDGISKVSISGYPAEEIEISFREDDLRKYGLTLDEAFNAIRRANIDLTGGTIRGKSEELRIRTKQKQYFAADMQNIVLRASQNGGSIKLYQVADVKDKWSESPNRRYVDGKPAVVITVRHTEREDIIYISKAIEEYIHKFNAKNETVKATLIDDHSTEIVNMQNILIDNGVMGFLLVLLFLSLFLNHRLSFWVAASIPISFMGMFILAAAYGVSINKLSLFGMILVIGILVDDGIVICENIYQHYEKGKSPLKAAIDGTMEVFPAVFSAVLTTIVAFSTFFFLEGRLGQFFVDLAFVVIGALIFSLIEGALILPAHVAHSKALKRDRKVSKLEAGTSKIIYYIRITFYDPLLRFSLRNKTLTFAIPTGLFLITIGAMKGNIIKMGDTSVENVNEVEVSLDMPAGTSPETTMSFLNYVESKALETAEAFDGKANDGSSPVKFIEKQISSSNTGRVSIILKGSQERDFHSNEMADIFQQKVGSIPEAERVNFKEDSHFGKPVSLSLLSHDLEELELARQELKEELSMLAGLKNVLDDNNTGMREVKITLKDEAYHLGLTLEEVMSQVRKGFFGNEVQRLHRGLDEVKVWVRYKKSDRSSVGNLENMRIRLSDGKEYPLDDIANLAYERNLVSINHLNNKRQMTVEADVKNADVAIAEIKDEINQYILPKIRQKYPSLDVYFGGRDELFKKTGDSAFSIAPIILIILLSIITFTFRSFSQTIMVFALIPLGFIGVGWGHFIHGFAIDLPSYFGIVALMGIMVNDAIVLINTVNIELKNGKEVMVAIYDAATSRFRPIILTSLTTIAGLTPIILSKDPAATMVIPMAISVAYGLIVSTVVTLVFLPVLMVLTNQAKVYMTWLWEGIKPKMEEVEPAVKELNSNI